MYASGPFATGPFGDVSLPWAIVSGGEGTLGSTQTLEGVAGGIAAGTGSMGSTQTLAGLGEKLVNAAGSMGSTQTLAGFGMAIREAVGSMGSSSTLVGYGAAVEFPPTWEPDRIVTIGTRQYQWKANLGSWVPVSDEWAGGGGTIPVPDPNKAVGAVSDNVVIVEDLFYRVNIVGIEDSVTVSERITTTSAFSEEIVILEEISHDAASLWFDFMPEVVTEFVVSDVVILLEDVYPDVPSLNFDFIN